MATTRLADRAADAKEEPKRKVTIPLEEYEALQRKARETGGRAGAESGVRANTTDNRAVGGDGALMIGAGARYVGTDGGAVEVAKFNSQLMQAISENQTGME